MRPARVVRCPSILKNKYSNIFFYKTTRPTVLKFHMEHNLTPGTQNCKIGLGRISKLAAASKNSKNNKLNFFSRTTGYFGLNFGMEFQWNLGIQNCKKERKKKKKKKMQRDTVIFCLLVLFLLPFVCLNITYFNNFKQLFFSKTICCQISYEA